MAPRLVVFNRACVLTPVRLRRYHLEDLSAWIEQHTA